MADIKLQERVIAVIAQVIEEASGRAVELNADSALISSGHLDSLAVLQLFNQLQETFDVELDVDDLTEERFGAPRTIADLVEERM